MTEPNEGWVVMVNWSKLVNLLQGLEWSGFAVGAVSGGLAAYHTRACPSCRGVCARPERVGHLEFVPEADCFPAGMLGHRDTCELAKMLTSLTASQPQETTV